MNNNHKMKSDPIPKGKSDRDSYRICPSRLTKHELEELYFNLLESNSQYKKAIADQQERIKNLLNTKNMRITAQKVQQADEKKDCCVTTKCLIYQQRQSINNLRRENERLAERIRKLNVKLSSEKKYSRIPVPTIRKSCCRCAGGIRDFIDKENNLTSIETQMELPIGSNIRSVDVQTESEKEINVEYVEIQTDPAKETSTRSAVMQTEAVNSTDHICDGNKCRTQMNELKQKIVSLQEELLNVRKDYSNRIDRLENEVLQNTQRQSKVNQEDLSDHEKHMNHLINNIKAADELSNELKIQLAIEKKKVIELVRLVKDNKISNCKTNIVKNHPKYIEIYDKALPSEHFKACICCTEFEIYKSDHCHDNKNETIPQININAATKEPKAAIELFNPAIKQTNKRVQIPRASMYQKECKIEDSNELDDGLKTPKGSRATIYHNKNDNTGNKDQFSTTKILTEQPDTDKPKGVALNKGSQYNLCDDDIAIQSPNNCKNLCNMHFENIEEKSYVANSNDLSYFNTLQSFDDAINRKTPNINKTNTNEDKPKARNDNLSDINRCQDVKNNVGEMENNLNANKDKIASDPNISCDIKEVDLHIINKEQGSPRFINELPEVSNTGNNEMKKIPHYKTNQISPNTSNKATYGKAMNQEIFDTNNKQAQACGSLKLNKEDISIDSIPINSNTLIAQEDVDFKSLKVDAPETFDVLKNEPKVLTGNILDMGVNIRDSVSFTYSSKMSPTTSTKKVVDPDILPTQPNLMNDKQTVKIINDETKPSCQKGDQHNSLQIPGPIPLYSDESIPFKKWKVKENTVNSMIHKKGTKRKMKPPKETNSEEKVVKLGDDTTLIDEALDKVEEGKEKPPSNAIDLEGKNQVNAKSIKSDPLGLRKSNLDTMSPKMSFPNKEEFQNGSLSNIYTTHVRENTDKENIIAPTSSITDKEIIENNTEAKSKCENTIATQTDSKVTAQTSRVITTYRRKSGTLCFKTLPSSNSKRYHNCQCNEKYPCGGLINKGIQTSQIINQVSMPEHGICTTGCLLCSRDITGGVELKNPLAHPPEDKSKLMGNNAPYSRENKCWTEQAKYTTAATNTSKYDNNQEDVLNCSAKKGYNNVNIRKTDGSKRPSDTVAINKMHEKLQTIADELDLCKRLLQNQNNNLENSLENQVRETLGIWDEVRSQHALRQGVAMHNMSDTQPQRCVFTLHIGTVVLSDEAVLNSRGKSLNLTWKFYDQNVSMTRMRAGRVILFDFSTEYDILLTDDFLNYMKHEEMPILICELENQDKPYARCALPLCDALLHTNIRADMSLALVAGPQMNYARTMNSQAVDALDAGDEMGVLDLWCMLQGDPKLLPIINKTIALPSLALSHRQNNNLQIDEKENSAETSIVSLTKQTEAVSKKKLPIIKAEEKQPKLHRWGSSVLRLPSKEVSEVVSKDAYSDVTQQSSKYPEVYQKMHDKGTDKDSIENIEEQGDPDKGVIVNEVNANIKTSADMKAAMLAKNRYSLHNVARIPKVEDDIISQAQSSTTSSYYRNVIAKLQKLHQNKDYKDRFASYSKNVIKSDEDMQPVILVPEEQSDGEYDNVSRKYDNIGKLCGSKLDQTKKNVTIDTNRNRNYVNGIEEKPEKDKPDLVKLNDFETMDITILWLALNEECEAMCNPHIQRVYVAYSFLGRSGADLETPVSLPKPKHYVDKCYFNFKKTFQLRNEDLPLLGRMARCRAVSMINPGSKDCIVFSVISEPLDDPLGIESCEDIGYAYLYLGDLLAYSVNSDCYTEVIPVRVKNGSSVCGVLAVRLDGLDGLRRCLSLIKSDNELSNV